MDHQEDQVEEAAVASSAEDQAAHQEAQPQQLPDQLCITKDHLLTKLPHLKPVVE